MRLSHFFAAPFLVIINDFHVVAVAVTPDKTDSPLLVDPNRVLPFPVASQRFQLIPRGRSQYAKFRGRVKLEQFPQGESPDRTKPPAVPITKKLLRLL